MSPLPPWLRHCLQDRIISLLQVMHTAKYPEVDASYKNCHTDIYFKRKTVGAHSAKCWTHCHIFPSIQFVIRSFTGSSSQWFCFEVPTALSLSLILSFYRTNMEPIDSGVF